MNLAGPKRDSTPNHSSSAREYLINPRFAPEIFHREKRCLQKATLPKQTNNLGNKISLFPRFIIHIQLHKNLSQFAPYSDQMQASPILSVWQLLCNQRYYCQ